VGKDASPEDIRRAYRSLARKYHPDVNPNNPQAEERFKEINESYEVLSDPEKRTKYDQLGSNWAQYQQGGGDPGGFDWTQWSSSGGPSGGGRPRGYGNVDINELFGSAGRGGFSDFFEAIFGGGLRGGGRQGFAQAGGDLEQACDITLEEAFHGTTRLLQVDSRRLEVKIPPGVATGSRVRVAGEGQPGANGGPAGDILLGIREVDHARFQREGNDLRMQLPVDLYVLVLGGEAVVETLRGNVSLKVPPETPAGRVFRLRERGMPLLRSPNQYGDLYVEVQPIIPHDLTEREKDLYRELAELRR
jgi:curved DNA-binding protein